MLPDSSRPLYEVKANLFKGLAHPLRVRVLEVLSTAPEASVSELLEATGLEASHLSQHLGVLRNYRLVSAERRATIGLAKADRLRQMRKDPVFNAKRLEAIRRQKNRNFETNTGTE